MKDKCWCDNCGKYTYSDVKDSNDSHTCLTCGWLYVGGQMLKSIFIVMCANGQPIGFINREAAEEHKQKLNNAAIEQHKDRGTMVEFYEVTEIEVRV